MGKLSPVLRPLPIAALAAAALVLSACVVSSEQPVDCARFEGSTATPNLANLQPGQRFRAEWRYYNCGNTNWAGYQVVRTNGTIGLASALVQDWPPQTFDTIWIEEAAPTTPGRYRGNYQFRGPRGPFADFWLEITVAAQ